MAALDRAERRRLYLAIARESLLSGRFTMAALAGTEVAHLAGKGDPDEARAMVYVGAATIVGPKYDEGVAALSGVKPERLDSRDLALRTSALAVAELIRRPPQSDPGKDSRGQAQASLIADAERSLEAAGDMLGDNKK